MKKPTFLSSRDAEYLVKDAEKSVNAQRRHFLKQGLTLGGIMLLTGCDLSDNASVETALSRMSRFNDRVQGFLFSDRHLAPEYTESDITRPFPFNAFYDRNQIPQVDGRDYQLAIRGLVRDTRSWSLPELYRMQQVNQITRHICVEG